MASPSTSAPEAPKQVNTLSAEQQLQKEITEYRQPKVQIGDIVFVRSAPTAEPPNPMIVTKVEMMCIRGTVFDWNRAPITLSSYGYCHETDPRLKAKPTLGNYGTWSKRPPAPPKDCEKR